MEDYADPADIEEERSALWMQAQTWEVLNALYRWALRAHDRLTR